MAQGESTVKAAEASIRANEAHPGRHKKTTDEGNLNSWGMRLAHREQTNIYNKRNGKQTRTVDVASTRY